MHSFGHKTHSFGHNEDKGSDQKNSLTKVIQFQGFSRVFRDFQGFSMFFQGFQGF